MNSNCGSRGVPTTLLLDAMSGERLSPISPDLAPVIAQQYVRTPAAVTGVEVERYTPQEETSPGCRACPFDDADATEIVLDRQTGRSSKTKDAGGACILP